MSSPTKAIDSIQQRLTDYACTLSYSDLPPEVAHATKARIIDTLGVTIGGFHGETPRIARNVALDQPDSNGATILGTRYKVATDLAAFANATTARHVDMLDIYHHPGSYHGHGSDTLMPVLAAAEHAGASGRDFITAVVLSYEIMCRFCDVFHNRDFDNTTFACLATAIAASRLFGLSREQTAHAISMAVTPNVILRQVRQGQSEWKVVASGHAGRAGVFAAMLARAGMEGPHLPFEGKAGWCEHVARERFALDRLGDKNEPFRLLETQIKHRPALSETISSVMAAEKITPRCNPVSVRRVLVEVYARAKEACGTDPQLWNPTTHTKADHSIPYVVAATLIDGTVTPRSYDDAHLKDPRLQALIKTVEVVENTEFTQAYKQAHEHRTRVTVELDNGEKRIGVSGSGKDDLSAPKTDAEIEAKFLMLTADVMSARRVDDALRHLWKLEEMPNVAVIPGLFAL